jgi:hypothetical protein
VTEITSASCASLVEEILQQSAEDVEGEEQLENALLAMSEVFGQAGRLLGKRRRGDKGKGKGCVPKYTEHIYFFVFFIFFTKSSEERIVVHFRVCQD